MTDQYSETDDTTQPGAGGDNPDGNELELVTIEWRDLVWTVPKRRGLWDMNVQFELEDGKKLRGILCLLAGGPGGVATERRRLYAVCKTGDDLNAFTDHVTGIINKECV